MYTLWFPIISLTLALAGCDSGDTVGRTDNQNSSPQKATSKAEEEVKEAVDAVTEAASDKLDDFQKGIDARLAELDKQADALKQKAMTAKAEVKADIQGTTAKMDENKRLLRRQLSELQSASGKRVDELKKETDKTIRELEQSYQQAIERFSG